MKNNIKHLTLISNDITQTLMIYIDKVVISVSLSDHYL